HRTGREHQAGCHPRGARAPAAVLRRRWPIRPRLHTFTPRSARCPRRAHLPLRYRRPAHPEKCAGVIALSLHFLTKSGRWKRAGLAARITLLSALLTASVMLPILGLSYAALHSLLADKINADLRASATTTRLAFEARLATAVDKI